MPISSRLIFNKYLHAEPLFYAVLGRLSTGYPAAGGRLHTRYSPVRRSPPYCYVLPLDLHVLSLSLAFILSQDQTLHCNYCLFLFFPECPERLFILIDGTSLLNRKPQNAQLIYRFSLRLPPRFSAIRFCFSLVLHLVYCLYSLKDHSRFFSENDRLMSKFLQKRVQR